jgi:diphosphomevalonate decarboxylase
MLTTATAVAHPNIAFIKYWGNRDPGLRLPVNGSISMNLAGLTTRTQVRFDPALPADRISLNGQPLTGGGAARVTALLDRVRHLSGLTAPAAVDSHNSFPTGAGIASSASAFAALSVAASTAAGLNLDQAALSRLARRASGSACRSIPTGFAEWYLGHDDRTSYAVSLAPPEHWDLVDCIAIVSRGHKHTGSTAGHELAPTSPLQTARLADAPQRLDVCRRALRERDFDALAAVIERDSNLMHAVMFTSTPALLYWLPATLAVMHAVIAWRQAGLPVCYTIDAGPNVHVITTAAAAERVSHELGQIPGVQEILSAAAGGPAHLEPASLR